MTEMIFSSSMDANEPVSENKETQALELGGSFLLHFNAERGIIRRKAGCLFFNFPIIIRLTQMAHAYLPLILPLLPVWSIDSPSRGAKEDHEVENYMEDENGTTESTGC